MLYLKGQICQSLDIEYYQIIKITVNKRLEFDTLTEGQPQNPGFGEDFKLHTYKKHSNKIARIIENGILVKVF